MRDRHVSGHGSAEAGLSLVEVLVALAILAAIASVSLPSASELLERGRSSAERDRVELQLRDLGRRASRDGRAIELAAVPGADPELRKVVQLPAGWRVDATPPIRYRHDGVCSGGTVTVTSRRAVETTYTLEPPFCRPVRR